MKKKTSIEDIRGISKLLLRAVEIEEVYAGIVQHPFTNSRYVMGPNSELIDLLEEDDREIWLSNMEEQIEKAELDTLFYLMINQPWYLTWLEYIKPYMSKEDFSKYWGEAWSMVEFPNNTDKEDIVRYIKYFENADKTLLMSEEDYQEWLKLPDEVVLYRGVSFSGKPEGLSWTLSEKTARWFQNRFKNGDEEGTLYRVKVPKRFCLAYFNGRNEKEIILKTNVMFVKNRIEIMAA